MGDGRACRGGPSSSPAGAAPAGRPFPLIAASSSSSSSPADAAAETASTSVTKTINGSHHFKIAGYSLSKGIGVGKYIASESFTVGGYEWAIYFYPDGKSAEDGASYVSLFIALASEGTDVRALFELTLVDQSGKGQDKVHTHFGRSLEGGPYTLKYRGSMWFKRMASNSLGISGRHLLKGNYVPLLMCGKLSMFVVMGAELDGSALDVVHDKDISLSNVEVSAKLGEAPVSFLVDKTTKVYLSDSSCPEEPGSEKSVLPAEYSTHADTRNEGSTCAPRLGGLSKESAQIKEIISISLTDQICLPSTHVKFRYKGVLLHGPPGTGKTSLASSCAYDAGANLFTINGPEIISQYYGESEQTLYDVFSSAKQAAPALIFIDELDAIAPTRKDGSEELSLRMVATLLKLMDDIHPSDRVLLIAATNRPDSIDLALRRRFDEQIEIGVPSPGQRLDILDNLLTGVRHSLSREGLESLALVTHGFVGADLAALCNEAALSALRRYICLKDDISSLSSSLSKLTMSLEDVPCTSMGDNTESSRPGNKKDGMLLSVTTEDFEKAKMKVRPSAMREVMLELPKVRWEDVGGQARVKKQLIEAIQWPQKCPEAFERIGIRPPRGLLMIGPPGCSKTLMARAVASEAKLNFLAVKGPELFSKWVGDSEKAVISLFAKAKANAPAILFFDEIDGLAVTRGHENDGTSVADRVLSQLLLEMDGLDQRIGVTVIAATNRPDKIDLALLRPGRFDRLLDVQPPDEADREDIFRIHTRSMPCSPDVNLNELARLTEGYTGADIKLVCREAAIAALDESIDIPEVAIRHFKSAIKGIKPSDVKFYQELAVRFRRFVDDASWRKQ